MESTSRKRRSSTSYESDIDEHSPSLKMDVDVPSLKMDVDVPSLKMDVDVRMDVDLNVSFESVDVDVPISKSKKTDESSLPGKIDECEGFEDAALAGGCKSKECTLILTEGISARSFVTTFASYLGSEKFGIYPINGKIKNDGDGVHIKGLLMNLFHHVWPSLLKVDGFLCDFTTTLIKATNKQTGQESFFKSLLQQKKWEESLDADELDNWSIKYYKGLASNSDKEAFQYSQNMEKHLRFFKAYKDDDEEEELNMCMKTAFCKKSSDLRKKWLLKDGHVPNYIQGNITISKYIEEELFLFHKENIQRSIPSLMDGLKPSQRKVLFYLSEIENIDQKVDHLSGKVSEATCYHHGDKVLEDVIIRMAQGFSGSNNLNLLEANGQFGSRRKAGHDHGAARYINTQLSPLSRLLFLDVDYDLVTHKREDGKWVEPNWYAPIAPLVLINGAMGISTGYCSRIPSYNPTDVIANLRLLINKEEMIPMKPWYRDFKGKVEPHQNMGTYLVYAKWEVEDTKLKIFDLPPGVWFEKYEKALADKKTKNKIKDYKKVTTSGKVCFEIDLIEIMETSKLVKSFGLSKKVTTNLVLLDAKGHVKPYESIEQVMKEFFGVRLEIYKERKRKLLKGLQDELKNVKSWQKEAIQESIAVLKVTTPEELWKQDLEKLEAAWNCFTAHQKA